MLRKLLMTMPGCMSWQPGPAGPGTLSSDGTWQPGVSVLAASSAGVPRSGRALAFRSEERDWPRVWGPNTLICVVLALLLLPVMAASPTTTEPDRVYQQLAAPQGRSANLSEKCPSDKEEIAPFNRTDGIQCQCKPGTFQDENSPEMCQRCSLGCPVGKVMAKPCTPWNDIVCVDQESSTQARGETPVPGEPVTTTWNLSTSPSPSTDSPSPVSTSVVTVAVVVTVVVAVVVKLFLPRCRVCCICQGSGVATSCRNRVNWFLQHLVASFRRVFRYLCASGGPEALDNARNMIVNSRDSLPTSASEQELEQREHAGLPGVTVQTPGEAEHLLA